MQSPAASRTIRVGMSEPPTRTTRGGLFYGWVLVGAALVAGMLAGGLFTYGTGAFLLPLEDEFGEGRRGLLSLGIGLAPVTRAVLAPLQGYCVDRFGPRPVMWVGVGLMGGGWLLASQADSLVQFLICYLLVAAGTSMGLISPPLAAVANWFVRRRGVAFGFAGSGFVFGAMLVPLVAAAIEQLGWRGAAATMGAVIWVVGFPLGGLMRRRPEVYGLRPDGDVAPTPGLADPAAPGPAATAPPAHSPEVELSAREALRTSAFWRMYSAFALRSLVMSGLAFHFIAACVSRGFDTEMATRVLALTGLLAPPGRIAVGFLADRANQRLVFSGVSLLLGLALVILTVATEPLHLWVFAVLYATAIGGGGSVMFAMRGAYFGRRAFATISGVGLAVQSGGGMLGTALAGFLFDWTGSYDLAFGSYAALCGVGAVIILFARPPRATATFPA